MSQASDEPTNEEINLGLPFISCESLSSLGLIRDSLECEDRMTISRTRLGEVRDTAAFDHHKEGKVKPRILWERFPDKFTQSYGRCDAVRQYGVQSCSKGMTDATLASSTCSMLEVKRRDVSLLTHGGTRTVVHQS
jgi:hypothetical protein